MNMQLLIKRTIFALACLLGTALQGSASHVSAAIERERRIMRDCALQKETQAINEINDYMRNFSNSYSGIDLEKPVDAQGMTILMKAAYHGQDLVVEKLLLGIKFHAWTKKIRALAATESTLGYSAFAYALLYDGQNVQAKKNIILLLLQHGGDSCLSHVEQLIDEQQNEIRDLIYGYRKAQYDEYVKKNSRANRVKQESNDIAAGLAAMAISPAQHQVAASAASFQKSTDQSKPTVKRMGPRGNSPMPTFNELSANARSFVPSGQVAAASSVMLISRPTSPVQQTNGPESTQRQSFSGMQFPVISLAPRLVPARGMPVQALRPQFPQVGNGGSSFKKV